MKNDLTGVLVERIANIKDQMENFITRDEFAPVKSITYTLVTLILLAVAGALLKLVIK